MGWIKDSIETEKCIEIRKRREEYIRKKLDIVLLLLIGGSFYGNLKSFYPPIFIVLNILIIFFVYVFVEHIYMKAYSNYTDDLIRKNSRKR